MSVVPLQEARKIRDILKKSSLREATYGDKGVDNAGFVVGYDPRGGPDISISYEHSGSASDTATNTMLKKYENALKGIPYRMERHGKEHSCLIPNAHVHVYLA